MTATLDSIGIGSTVWVCSEYTASKTALEMPMQIVGETTRSWELAKASAYGYMECTCKVQKKPNAKGEYWTAILRGSPWDDYKYRVFFSREEVEIAAASEVAEQQRWSWIYEHRDKIKWAVAGCEDIATLRKVAELVGYKPDERKA